jgi:hypothetical protein
MTQQHYLNSQQDYFVPPDKIRKFNAEKKKIGTMDAQSIKKMGYGGYEGALKQSIATMDSAATAQIAFNTPALAQFFQHWLPGTVRAHTSPRVAERLLGFVQAGSFETETIVVRSLEQHAGVSLYGDLADVQQASYTQTYPYRHTVAFSAGLQTRLLESNRMGAIGINDAEEKRTAVEIAFEINQNAIALNGYNGGGNRTFGLFNDPNIEAYQTLPNGAVGASPLWSTKTWLEKTNDIRLSVNRLVTNTKTAFDPQTEAFTWAVPASIKTALTEPNLYGNLTLETWIKDNYPQIRIETIPELTGVNGGADGWYMYKDTAVNVDRSTDDGQTIINCIQAKMFLVASLPNLKGGVDEAYAQRLAGVIVKRPILVTRYSGFA